MGSVLFSIYISDLPAVLTLKCQEHWYAVNFQMLVPLSPSYSNETIRKASHNLYLIISYSMACGLLLNLSKSVAVCLGSKA